MCGEDYCVESEEELNQSRVHRPQQTWELLPGNEGSTELIADLTIER